MKELFLASVLIVSFATSARADSDGYYCSGADYIAYQFGIDAPTPPHRLTIVRFGSSGFQRPIVVDLPQFQVHGMNCGEHFIRVAGFDAIYTVALDSAPRVVARANIPVAERGHFPTDTFVQRNLGSWSRLNAARQPDRILLGKTSSGRTFELVITPAPSSKPCTLNIESALVDRDSAGKQLETRLVFRGERHLECGGAAPAT